MEMKYVLARQMGTDMWYKVVNSGAVSLSEKQNTFLKLNTSKGTYGFRARLIIRAFAHSSVF